MGTVLKCLLGAVLFVGAYQTTRKVVRELELGEKEGASCGK